jgi:hypothetical protein
MSSWTQVYVSGIRQDLIERELNNNEHDDGAPLEEQFKVQFHLDTCSDKSNEAFHWAGGRHIHFQAACTKQEKAVVRRLVMLKNQINNNRHNHCFIVAALDTASYHSFRNVVLQQQSK